MIFEFTAYFKISLKGIVCSRNTFKNSTLNEPWGPLAAIRADRRGDF